MCIFQEELADWRDELGKCLAGDCHEFSATFVQSYPTYTVPFLVAAQRVSMFVFHGFHQIRDEGLK